MQPDARDEHVSAHATARDPIESTPARDTAWAEQAFRHARAAHERGALADAERGYLALLALDHDHAEALHMLGVLQFQEEKLSDAEVLIRHSIEQRPSPLALANHAAVLNGLGRVEEALEVLDQALRLNPGHPRALLQRAGVLADQGHLEEAVTAYDRLLEVAPTFVDGLCRRSAVLRDLTRFEEALASCDQALMVDGRSFEAQKERGQVLRNLDRHEDALESFGRALMVIPGDAHVLFLQGVTFLDLHRLDLALASFNDAVAGSPDFTEASYNSAVVLERLGRFEDALARCERVLAAHPSHTKALANLGNILQGLGRNAEAVASYTKALEVEPISIDVLCNQANALRHLDRRDEALWACERALELDSECIPAWFNRSRVLHDLHRYEEALAGVEHVLVKTPADRFAQFHRGNVLMALRRHEEAKDAFGQAIAIDPDFVQAHCTRAFLCLALADFRSGWEEYEWRWRDAQMTGGLRKFAQIRWTGAEPLAGKTILLHSEQGLGDTLQFCRYVPLVKALGATVVLEAQPELKSLLATLSGVDLFIEATGAPLPPFDIHCPLLSLPLAFGTELSTIPSTVPYLKSDPAQIAKWRTKLGTSERPRIGVVWSGNPKHLNDRNRSIPLADLQPLMSDAFEWVSLQKVVREGDKEALASSPLRHFGEELVDFSDTAALLQMVDCVLSVDTSVAHLAGALGRPLWVLLPHTPDFRWLLDREDSPWYPLARLFRQSVAGDWADVFERLKAALPSLVSIKGAARGEG